MKRPSALSTTSKPPSPWLDTARPLHPGWFEVTVAPVFGRLFLVPKLPEFLARYPDISVELQVSDRTVNLIEEGIDLAIHNGPLTDSSLLVRTIATTPVHTLATPAYLASHEGSQRPQATLSIIRA